jgi:hypothetical protein
MREIEFKTWENGEYGHWTFRSVFDSKQEASELIEFMPRVRALWIGVEFEDWSYSLTERFEYVIESDRFDVLDAPLWIFEVWTRKKEDAAAFVAAFSPTPIFRPVRLAPA